ncbi:MAG: hypothetical protein L0H73_06835 [Nitrococcus sp.]|nr:hypothetical protein [Nitrococcus sp.]
MSMTTQQHAGSASFRTVVMLRRGERDKLNALASRDGVSVGEIVRRAIGAYDPTDNDTLLASAIESMSSTLREAIVQVHEARASVAETRAQLRAHALDEVANGDR